MMEREDQLARGGSERQLTKEQGALIKGYRVFSGVLAEGLTTQPELKNELSTIVHDPNLTYRDVLRRFFYESGRNFRSVVESLLVRAFEATPQCTEEEKSFLSEVRGIVATTDTPPENTLVEFQEWVDTRISFMTRGLQYFARHGGVIEPLSPEEIKSKSVAGHARWREANPDRWTKIQRQITQAAADAAQPRVFKYEIRVKIQEWFDRKLDYQTVAELLEGVGVITSIARLKQLVHYYPEMHYTLKEVKERERQGFARAAEQILHLTESKSATVEILSNLGYSKAKTEGTLAKQGLKEGKSFNWHNGVEIEGRKVTVEELVLDFTRKGGYSTLRDEYQAFISYLQQIGLDSNMTETAYKLRRQKLLKSINSQDNELIEV